METVEVTTIRHRPLRRAAQVAAGCLALAAGGLIYIIYRYEGLLMFAWFRRLGLDGCVAALRSACGGRAMGGWAVYSLPAGLWLLAYLLVMDAVWAGAGGVVRKVFLSALPVAAVASELLQLCGWLSGTFDWLDLAGYGAAVVLYLIIKHR